MLIQSFKLSPNDTPGAVGGSKLKAMESVRREEGRGGEKKSGREEEEEEERGRGVSRIFWRDELELYAAAALTHIDTHPSTHTHTHTHAPTHIRSITHP